MLPLDDKYWKKIEALAGEVQAAEELQKYLEEEEEEQYQLLKDYYEPKIGEVYRQVADQDPLQLVALEKALLHEAFEGLFLPRILGYSVLRGEVDENRMKYVRPQEHFKEVLMAIANSANFDIIRKRIGQSIQMGFALSSDIWVTNLVDEISNKRIRYFLNSQRLERYRQTEERKIGYERYARQFVNENFQSAEFPASKTEFQFLFTSLKKFLIYRVRRKLDNSSIVPYLKELIANEEFYGMQEHLEIMGLNAHFFDLDTKDAKHLGGIFNKIRKEDPEFNNKWFVFVLELHKHAIDLNDKADQRISALLDPSIKDNLTDYYKLMDILHSKGYMSEETQEAVRVFYNRFAGLSDINECLRMTIYNYFARLVNNIEISDYHELFDVSKYFAIYMQIFGNQQFNQNLEDLSMKYVRKLLKKYTDKRGKDYQDIKKFVSTTFQDLGFLTEKEVVELFKTRRKRKKADA